MGLGYALPLTWIASCPIGNPANRHLACRCLECYNFLLAPWRAKSYEPPY